MLEEHFRRPGLLITVYKCVGLFLPWPRSVGLAMTIRHWHLVVGNQAVTRGKNYLPHD